MDFLPFVDNPVSIVYQLSFGLIVFGAVTFIALQFLKAPYGRYHDNKLIRFECSIPGKLGWFIMESPNLIIPLALITSRGVGYLSNTTNGILFLLYISHYIYRDLVYPYVANPKPLSLTAFLAAFTFCCVNGIMQSLSLMEVNVYDDSWMYQPNFIIGILLWAFGLFTNAYSDYLLRNLRKPGDTGYKVPKGFMFEFVSCANFFGEIVEWTGYALACYNISGFAFAFATATNLIPRGVQHHQYYLQKMDNYPKNRKAVLPFIL